MPSKGRLKKHELEIEAYALKGIIKIMLGYRIYRVNCVLLKLACYSSLGLFREGGVGACPPLATYAYNQLGIRS